MSVLNDNSLTIYEVLENIKNGRYVMPAFQREYVWSTEQVEKLWDSILLDYPISNFLFWHIDDTNVTWDTYFCNFLKKAVFNSSKQADNLNFPINSIDFNYTNIAILDGQQRLTSIYLSLLGETYLRPRFANKNSGVMYVYKLFIELDKNKGENENADYNSKQHNIYFTTKGLNVNSSPTLFELRNILGERFQNNDTREQAIEEVIKDVPDNSKEYAKNILLKLYNKIFVEKLIRYTEITDMSQDDALEMFIRFNNGGKKLRKQEITMSIFEVYWPNKGSRLAYEVLYFIGRDWINEDINSYEQDHLHPESRFSEPKPFSISTEEWQKWYVNRNRLPNLQLLDDTENKSKSNRRLIDYYNDMNDEQKQTFIKQAIIPNNTSLEIENFSEFYEKRKQLLKEKILELLK